MNEYNHKIDNSIFQICSTARTNEIVSLIVFIDQKSKAEIRNRLNEIGCSVKYELDILGAFAVDAYAKRIEDIIKDKNVIYVASDAEATTYLDIARPVVGADATKYTGKGVVVAVVDTGIYPHTDLTSRENRIVEFVDFVEGKKKPYDDNGHGTHCSGIIAGNGSSSKGKYKGIAPNADLIGIKVMNANGEGKTSDILAGLDWVWKNKDKYNIRVVSISLGAYAGSQRLYDPMMIACEKLWDSGVVVVAAAGNEGPDLGTIGSPGVSRKIITVGCSDDIRTIPYEDDKIPEFSSRGPSPYTKSKPDLVAPGVNIMSLSTESGGYRAMSGTSMSTPMVSGACALLLEKNPNMTPNEVKQKLIRSAYSLKSSRYEQGNGVLNLRKLLN